MLRTKVDNAPRKRRKTVKDFSGGYVEAGRLVLPTLGESGYAKRGASTATLIKSVMRSAEEAENQMKLDFK